MLILVLVLMLICALQSVLSRHTLHATLWLAAVSALAALALYLAGAWQIAVIELSVGTGLVTVLMVFAITIVGDELESSPPHWLALSVTTAVTLTLMLMTMPQPDPVTPEIAELATVLWDDRALDIIAQMVLMFAAVMGIAGILRIVDMVQTGVDREQESEVAV